MKNSVSLSAIHTFTVVAEESSFTRAAEVLHITPSAVSHQMKLLESQMGVALFIRQSKGVRLSPAGETLLQYSAASVKKIQYGIVQSRFTSQKKKLVIAVIPSLCQLWLISRLTDFYCRHPDIELELIAADQLVDFDSGHYDGHLHFGSGEYLSCSAEFLSHEYIYPVCHPQLLEDSDNSSLATLMQQHPILIYKAGMEDERGGVSWDQWFRHCATEKPPTLNQMWYSHVSLALTASKHQQGIALGWHKMVESDLKSEQLTRLTDNEIQTTFDYYLVAPSRSWKNSAFTEFSCWLKAQMNH